MIVKREGDSLLLVTQPEHAKLSGRIMTAWKCDDLPAHPRRETVLLATRQHDIGWQPVDRRPAIDTKTGQPHHFMTAPDATKRGIWPRGVARLESRDPSAAALIAQHALTVLDRQPSKEWQRFFSAMETERDRIVATSAFSGNLDELLRDYRFVLLGDLLSLVFCCGWRKTFHRIGYDIRLRADRLVVRPDPFEGLDIELAVETRRIPMRRYTSDDDLHRALAAAPPIVIRGHASGP